MSTIRMSTLKITLLMKNKVVILICHPHIVGYKLQVITLSTVNGVGSNVERTSTAFVVVTPFDPLLKLLTPKSHNQLGFPHSQH